MLALAYVRRGYPTKAYEQLRELLEATCSEGYIRLFLDEGEELADLLRGLLPSLYEKKRLAYARHILSSFALQAGVSGFQTTSGIAPWLSH